MTLLQPLNVTAAEDTAGAVTCQDRELLNQASSLPARSSAILHRDLRHEFLHVAKSEGHYYVLDDGRRIFDASGGAAVACLGHGNKKVLDAMYRQMTTATYCPTNFFTHDTSEELGWLLSDSTGGHMTRTYIVSSGSAAMEAAMKLSRQYFLEKSPPEPSRCRFISRKQSYHGITLGALSLGGHEARRAKFSPMLSGVTSRVSPCFAYRGQAAGETTEAYVARLARELEDEFIRVGPETVCAFVAEPVVGAALGCVPAVEGYFKAMRHVCDKFGALLIMDEVMCGMGRTGTLHAWQGIGEGVAPDIQTIGKGLGGGYDAVAGVLVSHRVADALEKGTGVFVHGQTYQAHPVACAAALEVQRVIQAENLLSNVVDRGSQLSGLLMARLASHPHVGDIRGAGLFWGIEFVEDKDSKRAFPKVDAVASCISQMALAEKYGITVYEGSGTVDGKVGDHIILAPPYTISKEEVEFIAETVQRLVYDFFRAKYGSDNLPLDRVGQSAETC